jgi:anti-sigma B factor antagonist
VRYYSWQRGPADSGLAGAWKRIGGAVRDRHVTEWPKRRVFGLAQRYCARVRLSISTEQHDGEVVVTVAGDIDVSSASQLRQVLHDHLENDARQLVVDLEGVDFCDSTGLAVFIAALHRARSRGGGLALTRVQRPVLRVLRVTGLDRVFTIKETGVT